MASLTQSAIIARKIIRYSVYAIATIIVARYTFLVGSRVWQMLFPEPPPPPTCQFGILPDIPFPSTGRYDNLTFALETPTGQLPESPPQAFVYFMPRAVSNIRSLERAKNKAKALGFDPAGIEVSGTVMAFKHESYPADLVMNIVTSVFSISYDLNETPGVITGTAPSPSSAVKQAKSFFSGAGLLTNEISGPTTHELLKIENSEFVRALSLSDTNFIKVNLFRKNYKGSPNDKDEYPSMTLDPSQANMWLILGASTRKGSRVFAGENYYYPVDVKQFESYPIKSPSQAWEELNLGKSYTARLGSFNKPDSQIKVRRVYLGYFDPGEYTEFYQPIYVFEEGIEDGFVGYVSAIGDCGQKNQESSEK